MTDEEIIRVVSAHKEGKKIQGKCARLSNIWVDLVGPIVWDFGDKEYRVAPEPHKPKEWWLDFKDGGKHAEVHGYNYCGDCVHVQEIEGATSGEPGVIPSTVKTFSETPPRKPIECEFYFRNGFPEVRNFIGNPPMNGTSIRVREVLE